MAKDILYTKVLVADASYQLVRTNPKLTGNVKLTINEAGDMWLDAIKANLELAKDDYSRYPIDTTQSLPGNIYQFFKNGTTPNEIIFGLSEGVDTTKTSKDFKDQYDFSNYFSGIKYFPSNKYEERLSYFAPLYLKKELPRFFVIFKINDPLNTPIDISKQDFENGQPRANYLVDLFKKATIIKTFDLREDTKPGKFIRSYLNSPNFPISPLTVAYEEEEYTTWNGMIVDAGVLGSRGELLYDQYRQSTPLKFFEENVTKGYERNGIIFPNILNLEFIFNDDSSQNYEINRYLGVYLNTIELSELDIDLERGYAERKTWENTPRFRTTYKESDDTTLLQSNSNGVIIPYKNLQFNISEFTNIFTDSETLYFNYITDKSDKLYLPKLVSPYDISLSLEKGATFSAIGTDITVTAFIPHNFQTDDFITVSAIDSDYSGEYFITKVSDTIFTYKVSVAPTTNSTTGSVSKDIGSGKIRLSNTSINLGKFFGPSEDIYLQDTGFVAGLPGYSYGVFKILANPNHADQVKLYHPNGTQSDSNGNYDLFTGVLDYSLLPNPGEYYIYNDWDNVTGFDEFYFSTEGRTDQIASSLAAVINGVRNKTFTAYAFDEYVFVICNTPGDFDALHKFEFISPVNDYTTISIDDVAGTGLISTLFDFHGGSKIQGNRLVIDANHLSKITQEFDNLLILTTQGWSKIKKISKYIDLINETNGVKESTRVSAISKYNENIVLTLEDSETPTISYTQFAIRKKFRPEFGLLSLFPIKDLDFDFYNSTYSNFPSIDLYQYYFIPENAELLVSGQVYQVINGTVSIDDGTTQTQYSDTQNNLSPYVTQFIDNAFYSGSVGFVVNSLLVSLTVGDEVYVSQDAGYTNDSYNGSANITNVVANYPGAGQTTLVINKGWGVSTPAEPGGICLASVIGTFTVTSASKYSIVSGEPIVIYAPDSNLLGGSLITPINDENKELKDFNGFSILKDPNKVIPQENTTLYNLQTKYINGLTNTEYDFYKENDSKDFSVRSKIIPYITKWRIKDGFDSRDNPYRLNTEIVFGRNNFSPDHTDRTQNPNNFTHEWFYIESKFNYLLDPTTIKQNDYYFDKQLDITQLLSDPNYFIEYFTYTPADGTNTYGEQIDIAPTQFRYSTVFKNAAGQYETFFKGFKVSIKDVTDPTVSGADGKPVAKTNSSRFDGYKFSCILKPVEENLIDRDQSPIRYRVIDHSDFKFILVVIEVALGSLTQIDQDWYVKNTIEKITNNTAPSSNEAYFADPTLFPPKNVYQTVDGDYRVVFDNGVSNLTHTLLYSLKHKKFNSLLSNFSNAKVTSKINLTFSGFNVNNNNVARLENTKPYPSILSDEIILPSEKTFLILHSSNGKEYIIDQYDASTLNPLNVSPVLGASTEAILLSTKQYLSEMVSLSIFPYTSVFTTIPLAPVFINAIEKDYSFYLTFGGEQYFEKLIEKLSFAKFKKYINELDPFIEYESYSLDSTGNPVATTTPNYYLEVPDQAQVEKLTQTITNIDDDRPTQYAFKSVISYTYEQAALNNSIFLNRYKGEYEPIANDLLNCRSNFKFIKNKINDLSLSNTKLNSHILEALVLRNFSHIKVADTKILDLESDAAYLPVYPTIDEIAIGKADYFLLSSNWDWGFHHKYSDKSNYSPVAGSLRVEEDENFLGKIVIIPPVIELENYKTLTLTGTQKLEDVDLTQVEIVIKETQKTVDGYINVNNVISSYLINDGIEQKFNEYLINSNEYIGNFDTIQSYVKEYIRLNILKLYNIDTVEFYTKRNAELVSSEKVKNSNTVEFVFLNDKQRFIQGYSLLRSVKINKTDRLILRFSIQKPVDAGLSISPKIKINFI